MGELHALVCRAAPFADLSRAQLENVLDMLAGRYPSDAFAELRPRIVWDRSAGTIRACVSGARRLSGGRHQRRASDPRPRPLRRLPRRRAAAGWASLDEEMVYVRRAAGQTFLVSSAPFDLADRGDFTRDRVLVTPAPGLLSGAVPFWKGEGVGRPYELGVEKRIGAALARSSRRSATRRQAGTPAGRSTCSTSGAAANSARLPRAGHQADATGAEVAARPVSTGRVVVERFPRRRSATGAGPAAILDAVRGAGCTLPGRWQLAKPGLQRLRSGSRRRSRSGPWTTGSALHFPDARRGGRAALRPAPSSRPGLDLPAEVDGASAGLRGGGASPGRKTGALRRPLKPPDERLATCAADSPPAPARAAGRRSGSSGPDTSAEGPVAARVSRARVRPRCSLIVAGAGDLDDSRVPPGRLRPSPPRCAASSCRRA